MIRKIVSGGQTGVDRLALDYAIANNIEYSGYIPKGRKCEEGVIPLHYDKLVELTSDSYVSRTKKNVETSDGTLVIAFDLIKGGTAKTIDFAYDCGKPLWVVMFNDTVEISVAALKVARWVQTYNIQVLNVAGPRKSQIAGFTHFSNNVFAFFDILFSLNEFDTSFLHSSIKPLEI